MQQENVNKYLKIGARLKLLRTNKKESQRDTAANLGIPVSTYSNYENENRVPKTETLKQIANYFNANVDWLLYGRIDLADWATGLENTEIGIGFLVVRIIAEAKANDELAGQVKPLLTRIIRLAFSENGMVVDTALRLKNTLIHNDATTAIRILENEIAEMHKNGGANILEPKAVPFGNSVVTMYGPYKNKEPEQEGDDNADEKDNPQG